MREVVQKWIARSKLDKLAELWVKGLTVDWSAFDRPVRPRRVSLPTYPFARERHWLDDPRFKDDLARGDNGEAISKRMAEWTATRTTAEALAGLEGTKIPAAPLYSPQPALEHAHIRTAKLLEDTDYPGLARKAPLAPTPVDLSETPGRFRHRAPTIGEHTAEILAELGYDRAAIEGLESRGVV